MRLYSCSTSIIEDRDPSTHLNILITRVCGIDEKLPGAGDAVSGDDRRNDVQKRSSGAIEAQHGLIDARGNAVIACDEKFL
jgi:hypothetical protein